MKKVTLIIRLHEISKVFPKSLQLLLEDNASTLDAIKVADKEIKKKCGNFPVKGLKSLLQMVYHPYEERFYRQVAIQGYKVGTILEHKGKPKSAIANRHDHNSNPSRRLYHRLGSNSRQCSYCPGTS